MHNNEHPSLLTITATRLGILIASAYLVGLVFLLMLARQGVQPIQVVGSLMVVAALIADALQGRGSAYHARQSISVILAYGVGGIVLVITMLRDYSDFGPLIGGILLSGALIADAILNTKPTPSS